MGRGHGYVHITHGSSRKDTYGMYATNWRYVTRMPVLDILMWPWGDITGLGLTNEDIELLRE
jgi:hypothetical protein